MDQNQQSKGFFKRLQQGLSKTRKTFSNGLESIFTGKNAIDEDLLEGLEELLITSDVGIQTTMDLIERVSQQAHKITDSDQLKEVLKQETLRFFNDSPPIPDVAAKPHVVMVVGADKLYLPDKRETFWNLQAACDRDFDCIHGLGVPPPLFAMIAKKHTSALAKGP